MAAPSPSASAGPGGLMSPTQPLPGSGYSTASGTQSGGIELIVRFTPQATSADIADALAPLKAQIVSGPKPGGMFEIRIPQDDAKKINRDAAIAQLKANAKTILLVLPKG